MIPPRKLRTLIRAALTIASCAGIMGVSQAQNYTNPVIPAGSVFPADPDVILSGNTYYLYPTTTASKYEVYTSTDMVSWSKQKNAVWTPTSADIGGGSPAGTTWAPDVYFHPADSKYYLYWTSGGKIGVVSSTSPTSGFSGSIVLGSGIDAHLFRDDDGQLYLYWSKGSGTPRQEIYVRKMSTPTTFDSASPETKVVANDASWWSFKPQAGAACAEGRWMVKQGGVYYLQYSISDYTQNYYGIAYATSSSPLGPFTADFRNILAVTRDTIYGPGHHSLTTDAYGNYWIVRHQRTGENAASDSREIAIDPVWFDAAGRMRTLSTKGVARRAPATPARQSATSAVPVVSSGQAASGWTGAEFEYLVLATQYPGSFSATGLPPGLAINNHGIIYGVPTTAGTYNVAVSATSIRGTSPAVTIPITINASAAPGAYEGFAGYPSSIVNGTPFTGTGFTGSIRLPGGGSFTVLPTSLTYGALQTSGGSITGGPAVSNFWDLNPAVSGPLTSLVHSYTVNSTVQRNLDKPGTSVYISFLVKSPLATNSGSALLGVFNDGDSGGDGGKRLVVGVQNDKIYLDSYYNTGTGSQNLPAVTPNQPILFVIRLDQAGVKWGTDQARVYINPPLGSEPAIAAYSRIEPFPLDRLMVRADGSTAIDEIRIGDSWASVLPVSTPVGLGVVSPATTTSIPMTGRPVGLSALGSDNGVESGLTYTWSVLSAPAGAPAVSFGVNGTNAAKSTTATFGATGNYTLQALISNGSTSVTTTTIVSVGEIYEPFDYATGSAYLQSGGKGWGSGWWTDSSTTSNVIAAPGMTLAGLTTAGNTLNRNGSGFFYRTFASPVLLQAGGADLWMSALVNYKTFNANAWFGLNLKNGDTDVTSFGRTYNSSQWGISVPAYVNAAKAIVPNEQILVVMRLKLNTTGNHSVYYWINPSLASEPNTATADVASTATISAPSVDRIAITTSPTDTIAVDEIRFGSSWQSVGGTAVPPTAPTGLTATAVSQTTINLAWADTASNETGFEVERSPDGSTGWMQIAAPAANSVSFSSSGLTAGTTYYYRVRAVGTAGASAFSNVASATTQLPPVPVITSGQSVAGVVNTPLSYAVQASSNPTSFAITGGTLPAGLGFNGSTGVISGTPTAAGTSVVSVTATNGTGTSTPKDVTITIQPLAFTSFEGGQSDFDLRFVETLTGGTPSWATAGVQVTGGIGNSGYLATSANTQTALYDQAIAWNVGETYTMSVYFKARVTAGSVAGGGGLRLGFADDNTGTLGGAEYVSVGINSSNGVGGTGDQSQLVVVSRQTGTVTTTGPNVGTLVNNNWYQLIGVFTKTSAAGQFNVVVSLKDWGADGQTGGTLLGTSGALAATGLTNVYNSTGVFGGFSGASNGSGNGVLGLDDFKLTP